MLIRMRPAMVMTMNIKQRIIAIAQEIGFHRVVIGSLAPMERERQEFEQWLAKGFSAGMDYLKRNPHFRTSPQLLFPGSKCAIIVSVSYYSEPPAKPAPYFGRVARYAVGRDYHAVIRQKLRLLQAAIEAEIGGRSWLKLSQTMWRSLNKHTRRGMDWALPDAIR